VSSHTPAAQTGTFAQNGEFWTISYGGESFSLKEVKGLSYLQLLLQHPNEEFHALDLMRGPGMGTLTDGSAVAAVAPSNGLSIGGVGDAGEMLDAQAKREYRRRLGELRTELAELREHGDGVRGEAVEAELDFIERELVRAVGLGGRDRRAGSAAERARLNVTRAIRSALQKITERHAILGELLESSVKTGLFSVYAPRPANKIAWRFSLEETEPAQDIPVPAATIGGASPAPVMVGRDSELALMRGWYEQAEAGARQIIFIAGEVGIGKTSFARALVNSLIDEGARVGWGQCIEQYGAGEPYMPVLEALTRLARAPGGESVVATLKKFAPNWLLQMPSLLSESEREHQQAPAPGLTHQRMLREMAEALEALAAETPLVLVLEDLHWSDFSTIELISMMARRTERARLLMVGTYRPVQILASEHPLRTLNTELELHQQCRELRLRLLSDTDIAEYLEQRFGGEQQAEALKSTALMIHRRTEGNPLFVVNIVDYLIQQGTLLGAGPIETPSTIQRLIEHNLERLTSEEQQVLEGASVIGAEFSAATVAAALERPASDIETCCARLARREQFVAADGTIQWPDGTVASMFRFHHTFYGEVLYGRLAAGQRIELHRRIAEREEAAWGKRTNEIAAELAHHYTQAGKIKHAIGYLERAGKAAESHYAFKEAQQSYQQALALVTRLAESPERDRRELELANSVARMFQLTEGWGAFQAVEAREQRAILLEKSGSTERMGISFATRAFTAYMSGDLRTARTLLDEALKLRLQNPDPTTLAHRYMLQMCVHYYSGDPSAAEKDFITGLAFFEDNSFKNDPVGGFAAALGTAAWNAWLLGRDKLARERAAKLMMAVNGSNPHDVAFSSLHSTTLHLLMREYEHAKRLASRALELCEEYRFPNEAAFARCVLGHALTQLKANAHGIALMRQGIAELLAIGSRIGVTYWITALADAHRCAGALSDAFTTVEQALEFNPAELVYRPEGLRVRGEIRLELGESAQADSDFRESLALAQKMRAKAWELRSTLSFARILTRQGRRDEAYSKLRSIYNSFTESVANADVKEAKALLDHLSG